MRASVSRTTTEVLDRRFVVVRTRPERQRADFLRDVRHGLGQKPKRLPCRWFYDAEGSRLFEEICGVREYYLTMAIEYEVTKKAFGVVRLNCAYDAGGPNGPMHPAPGLGSVGQVLFLHFAVTGFDCGGCLATEEMEYAVHGHYVEARSASSTVAAIADIKSQNALGAVQDDSHSPGDNHSRRGVCCCFRAFREQHGEVVRARRIGLPEALYPCRSHVVRLGRIKLEQRRAQ